MKCVLVFRSDDPVCTRPSCPENRWTGRCAWRKSGGGGGGPPWGGGDVRGQGGGGGAGVVDQEVRRLSVQRT